MLSATAAIARRLPRTAASTAFHFRMVATGRTEGSVAQSKGFNKKEKAQEDQYIHRHEMEQLAKLKAQIEAKKQELSSLQKEHADSLEKNSKA